MRAAIAIRNFAFSPGSLTIRVGTTVVVTNDDSVTHTWTANKGGFDSGDLAPGQSFQFTFANIGIYAYHCAIHTFMTGTITVTT